jgi:hypothetical protein
VYGRPMSDTKRRANSNVVQMILNPQPVEAENRTSISNNGEPLARLWSRVVLEMCRSALNPMNGLVAGACFEAIHNALGAHCSVFCSERCGSRVCLMACGAT